MCRVGPETKTLGSGLNAGNIGAEIDVIQPALPAQTHAPIAIRFLIGAPEEAAVSFRPPHSPRADSHLHSEQIGRAIDDVLRRRLVHDTERIADFHFLEHRGDLALRLRDRHAVLDAVALLRDRLSFRHRL